jgi:hypothetical protein
MQALRTASRRDGVCVPVPIVDDGDRELGDARIVLAANVASHADALPAVGIDSDTRLVIVVVDLTEVVELGVCQAPAAREKARVAGVLAEPLEAIDQALLVVWIDRPDLERVDAHHPGRKASGESRHRGRP